MISGIPEALRFARGWGSPPPSLSTTEVQIPVPADGSLVAGTVVSLPGDQPREGWIVLHGMSRRGREHPELRRFVGAVAATGARVLVPEVREWANLDFAPLRSQEVLEGAVEWMHRDPLVRPGGVVLVGFSFGAPQALIASSRPAVAARLRGVVGWGGYQDLRRTFHFAFTGEHEWEGVSYRNRPDPYVRWIIGANAIPLTTLASDPGGFTHALREMAIAAGERRIGSMEPTAEPLRQELRGKLVPADRELFDLFTPRWDEDPDPARGTEVVDLIVPLILQTIPLVEPAPETLTLTRPVRLLHGRTDRLIPYTETLRLGRSLETHPVDLSVRLTGLFGHSGGEVGGGGLWDKVRENLNFLQALREVFRIPTPR